MRLWCFLPFVPFQVAGGFWFGYALQNGWSWPQVAMSYGLATFGAAPMEAIALVYITDAYNEVCGSMIIYGV